MGNASVGNSFSLSDITTMTSPGALGIELLESDITSTSGEAGVVSSPTSQFAIDISALIV